MYLQHIVIHVGKIQKHAQIAGEPNMLSTVIFQMIRISVLYIQHPVTAQPRLCRIDAVGVRVLCQRRQKDALAVHTVEFVDTFLCKISVSCQLPSIWRMA